MNTLAFVRAIKAAVHKAAATGTLNALQKPAGRRPDPELVKLSQRFQSLNLEDRQLVAEIVDLATGQATYNFLLILDGLLAVEPAGKKARLELYYDDGNQRTRLNDESSGQLSFMFKARD